MIPLSLRKPVVLFVDDEPNILSGLKRLTRAKREDWDMRFVEGGPAGVAALAAEPIDALISDMRMPGLDGPSLLREAARRRPAMLRVVLSGEADQEMTLRTVDVSHRFLSKPCDADTLIAAIDEPLRLKNAEAQAGGRYYSEAGLTADIERRFLQGAPDASNLIALADQDPALLARLLQLANSAYFGRPSGAASAPMAVNALSLGILRTLAARDLLASEPPAARAADVGKAIASARALAAAAAGAAARDGRGPDEQAKARALGLLSALPAIDRDEGGTRRPSHAYCAAVLGLPAPMRAAMAVLDDAPAMAENPAAAGEYLWRAMAYAGE